ncbi:MAG: hypothetical protein A2Y73_07925 [Chloroflexi bacterium RBG_13_56_8]|nr:MAG: hypothetical protein A2Y73_07925 [Chloroflexi bacterium RBG_13_56_8]
MPKSNSRKHRVVFSSILGSEWTAGPLYLGNLLAALRSLDDHQRPEIALLISGQDRPDGYRGLIPYVDQLLHVPRWLDFWQRQMARIRRKLNIWLVPDPPLAFYLRRHGVDSIFTRIEFEMWLSSPSLAWMPDFQHLHLPEMFPPKEILARNTLFAKVAERADCVILSSQDALRDLESFAPQQACKGRVLPFVAQVPADIYDSDPAWICDHYDLPRRFVYLPNQFWRHKNHAVVAQALVLVKAQHPEITVVCTGNTRDYRDLTYFPEWLSTISSSGLRDNLILLGLVPRGHVFQLMRQSLTVLQPSLFEGWSSTVEEAKSVGKRIILSDIPVHREQDPPKATFFDPHDPQVLADCLVKVFDEQGPGPDYELEALAREHLPIRTRAFGQTFLEILQEF